MWISRRHIYFLSFAFSIWFSAQLLTIDWNGYSGSAHRAELNGILESIKRLREEYESRIREFPMWESNSIGLSLSMHKYVHLESKSTSTIIEFKWHFFRLILTVVVQHLLNLSFWVTSLEANDESPFFGNLTTNHPSVITLDNFAELIDGGTPSATESGNRRSGAL